MSQHIEMCRLCGQVVHSVSTMVPGYQLGQTYTIFECNSCLTSFATPLEADDALYDLIYSNIRSVPGYNRYYGYAHEVLKQRNPLAYLSRQEESYWAVTHHVSARETAGETVKVLEVGCGMGYFSYALRQSGFNVTGVDLSPTAVAWAREHYGPYYECTSLQTLKDQGEQYDVIIVNQLIEHLPDVHLFIAETLSLLSPTGEILLTTPNKSAYPEAEWETDLPPVHLWWFGEKAMTEIAQKHCCQVSFIDFTEFYSTFPRLKSPRTHLMDRQAVFDEQGGLLSKQTIPPPSTWRNVLERIGLLNILRRWKVSLLQEETWQGTCGPICACVLRPTMVKND